MLLALLSGRFPYADDSNPLTPPAMTNEQNSLIGGMTDRDLSVLFIGVVRIGVSYRERIEKNRRGLLKRQPMLP
jgi:hypothetical protein